ncbi:hypothetical protein NQ318_009777, partial [Aromia moschata]
HEHPANMSLNQHPPSESSGQSVGYDPRSSKRNSGLFGFLKWFKPSASRESIDAEAPTSSSGSSDSLSSAHSAGTCIALGPETDTYRARLKQRDKRRENDKNLTLRKKYNLFFNRETLLKPKPPQVDEENTKSLPLMTRATMEAEEDAKVHRRTNSESSKMKKAGAYLHVKGKRRAPQPPGADGHSTASLRRKKRLAPTPPTVSTDKVINTLRKADKSEAIQRADTDVICNDSLKLDHGILKPAKDADVPKHRADRNSPNAANSPAARSSHAEAPVSPRPWYKRNASRDSTASTKKEKADHKYEPIERLPEVPFKRNSTLDLTLEEVRPEKKKEEKRKSGMSFLTNISELDREASEIIKNKEQEKNGFGDIQEIPQFMRPRDTKINTDSWVSPKRRSARDLIAKFNAITNVTKVTVNSAIFGASPKESKLFGKQTSLDETRRRQESILESHKKRLEEIDKKNAPLMKSESASAIKTKPETPKVERKSWRCPKCNLENDYWRIICHVCSAIKPYFDDFSSPSKSERQDKKASSPLVLKKEKSPPKKTELNLERSKTQIGFSALASYNAAGKGKLEKSVSVDEKSQKELESKKEEREKLKKMLIEMKNSLPKRKSNIMMKQNSRTSIIVENPENIEAEIVEKEPEKKKEIENKESALKPVVEKVTNSPVPEKTQEEKVVEILIGTTEAIYENIKVRKTDNPKPVKVSSAAQTSAVVKQVVPSATIANLVREETKKNNYELMRPKDFEDIYADNNSKSAARIYANLARNDELSLFFNMPKNLGDLGQATGVNNTDTIEINRLLRRLETSIARGELTDAAIFAKELAQLKVNCSVIRQKPSPPKDAGKKKGFQIQMYVEDKVSHRGPFPIEVTADQTVAELKVQIENEFEIPADYQKWILGKELVTNENSTLKDYNITTEGCPVFLYLVAPDTKRSKSPRNEDKISPSTSKVKNPPNETKIIKEEIRVNGTPITKSNNEDKIEKVRMNVQNLQNKLNGNRNEIRKIEIVRQPGKFEQEAVAKPLILDTNSAGFAKAFTPVTQQQTKIPEPTKAPTTKELISVPQPVKPIDHTPKIVNVIPKAAEVHSKKEILIPITIEQREPKEVRPKPTSLIEIQIEEKPTMSTPQKIQKPDSKKLVKAESPPKNVDKGVKPKVQPVSSPKVVKETEIPNVDQKLQLGAEKKDPPKAKEEDMEEYDSKTLKPSKEWECHLCTLLNPVASFVCAACATVRLTQAHPPKKSLKKRAPNPNAGEAPTKKEQTYQQLVNLDNADLVENVEPFECVFCKTCLAHTIEYADEAEIKCPYRDDDYSCNIALQDREVKALVSPLVYEQHLAKSVAQAENKMDKSFHCKTPDCKGWCVFEDNVNEFRCPVCRKTNCLTCQLARRDALRHPRGHELQAVPGEDEPGVGGRRRRPPDQGDAAGDGRQGEAIECPTCKVILMKKWGCDWLRCSMCKTEICWVTRGPRWGPAGKGDTSGGCQCGLNGVKCHPKCNYCH